MALDLKTEEERAFHLSLQKHPIGSRKQAPGVYVGNENRN